MINLNSWEYLQTFFSVPYTQKFLSHCYHNFSEKNMLSFKNSYTFIYYLEHGKKYYNQASLAPYEIQPVLLFYGMIQLLKATILTVDPNYPETTQVLAHGVSTRKRKRNQYEFLYDEVKIQKNGLLTHFSEKVFHIKRLEGEKFKMVNLLRRIPELHSIFYYINKEKVANEMKRNTDENFVFMVDKQLLVNLNVSLKELVGLLDSSVSIHNSDDNEEKLSIAFHQNLNPLNSSPLQWNAKNNLFYMPTVRSLYHYFPELLVHYLILYNLSMICRYETDWWGELFHTFSSNDFPFITEFLEVTKYKVPYFISLIFKQLIDKEI